MPSGRAILGIDLRVTSVKVAEIEKRENGFTLKNWGMTEIPYQLIDKHPQLEDAKADALRKLIETHKIASRDAVVVAGGSDTFVKLYTLAHLPKTEAAQAIQWKLAEETTYPIEEAIFDFYPIERSNVITEKVDFVTACINRKTYNEAQYIIAKAGLRLAGITVLPDALQELYRPELAKAEAKIVSIIYMGKRTTNISIYRNGEFEFNRELNIGGENITRAMAGILVSPEGKVEITPEEAEKIKTEYGIPIDLENYPKLGDIPLVQLQAMVRPALEKVQSEVARTFEYYKGQTGEGAISQIILTGGSSMTPHLKEFLSTGLGIPILTPEPVAKLNPRLSSALGAAISGAEKINLMPEEVKYKWKLLTQKLLKPQLMISIFSGLLVVLYLFFWLQALGLRLELNRINQQLDNYKPKLARLNTIEQASKEEERKRLAAKSYEQTRMKMPRVFEEISTRIPQSITLNSMHLTVADFHAWGIVFKKNEAAETVLSRFVLGLSLSPIFENVKLVQATRNNEYATEAFNFELIGKIRN